VVSCHDYIWLHVFDYLSPFEKLLTLSLVCKNWNRLVERRCLWKTIDFGRNRYCSNEEANFIAKKLEKYGGEHTVIVQIPRVTPEICTALVKKCTSLKYLRICPDWLNDLDEDILLPNLKEFCIMDWVLNPPLSLNSFTRRRTANRLRYLERLELRKVHLTRDIFDRLLYGRCLKHVRLVDCSFEIQVDSMVDAIIGTLISLEIDNCMYATSDDQDDPETTLPCSLEDLLPLIKCMKGIRYMELYEESLWVEKDDVTLSQLTKDVPHLSLHYFSGWITAILGQNLLELTLVHCSFAPNSFKNIHTVCPKLQSFYLVSCTRLGLKSVTSLARLPNLTVYLPLTSYKDLVSCVLLRRNNVNYEFIPSRFVEYGSHVEPFTLRLRGFYW
jgi:hypothetical protein